MNFSRLDFSGKMQIFFQHNNMWVRYLLSISFAEENLFKFMSSDLALAIWSSTMLVNGQTLSCCFVALLQSCTFVKFNSSHMQSVTRQARLESLTYFSNIKIRHIHIKAHIYMLNDATLTSRISDIFTSRFFSNMYIKFPHKYTS